MALVSISDIYTKIPYVGCPLEINDIYNDYKKESKELDKESKTLRAMRKQFKEKERLANSNEKKKLERNIKNVDSALEKQSDKLEKVKIKAFKDAGISILQEGANMAMPGTGSLVAGLNRASSAIFFNEGNNEANLYGAAQDGFLAGTKDFILSTGADFAADGCSIQ